MKRAMITVVHLCVASSALALDVNQSGKAQEDTFDAGATRDEVTAIEILRKADAATKAVQAVSYDVTVKGTGALERIVPEVTGKVVLSGRTGDGINRFLIEIEGKTADGRSVEGTVGYDGNEFFKLDPRTRTAYVDIDDYVLGGARRLVALLALREFVHPTPFSEEINGDRRELKGVKKVGDEECYEIRVVYAGGRHEATWYFSKQDFLPRRVDRVRQIPTGGSGVIVVTLTSLKVNPILDASTFKAQIPDGWTKTDEPTP